MIDEKDEIQLYYLICDISKICKKYFYNRKYFRLLTNNFLLIVF